MIECMLEVQTSNTNVHLDLTLSHSHQYDQRHNGYNMFTPSKFVMITDEKRLISPRTKKLKSTTDGCSPVQHVRTSSEPENEVLTARNSRTQGTSPTLRCNRKSLAGEDKTRSRSKSRRCQRPLQQLFLPPSLVKSQQTPLCCWTPLPKPRSRPNMACLACTVIVKSTPRTSSTK